MLITTHLLAGLVASLLIIDLFNVTNALAFLIVFTFFSVLPDIDSHKSFVGSKVKPLAFIFEIIFGHRGFLHSMWIPLIIFVGFWFFGYLTLGLAAMLGYVLHLLLDSLTLGGVKFFGIKKRRGFVKTGGAFEIVLFFVLVILLIKILF